MIRSMTAYASDEAEQNDITVYCELRSVNHRYSDIGLRIPERLRFLEVELRTLLGTQIKRGKVECFLSYKKQSKTGHSFEINADVVTALLIATEQIELKMITPHPFSALEVLSFPGVQQELEIDKEELGVTAVQLIKKVLAKLMEVREREGTQLKLLIEERCEKMHHFVSSASQRMSIVRVLTRSKLKEKISELVAQPDFDRLEQELIYLAQKLDVAEELDRLETHITEVQRVLKEEDPAGKRLDFLMQEMNREANTLGSKSMDKQMTQIAIELKVLIEQMREQIQNIE